MYELYAWLIFVRHTRLPPAPASMTVIYRSRNDLSFEILEYPPAFLPSFCTKDLTVQMHRLKRTQFIDLMNESTS